MIGSMPAATTHLQGPSEDLARLYMEPDRGTLGPLLAEHMGRGLCNWLDM